MTLTLHIGPPPLAPPSAGSGDPNERVFVFWKIHCVNSQTKSFFQRLTVVKLWTLSETDRRTILRLVANTPSNPLILEHRSKFSDTTLEEMSQLDGIATGFCNVSLHEYFEDENGRALDAVGLFQVLSGQPDPIIFGNVESVLRFGPAGLQQLDKWTASKANNIAHFLRIVERVALSEWYRSPLSAEYAVDHVGANFPSSNQLINWKHPRVGALREVLLSLRQLYSEDDVFNFACNDYRQHVAHDGKRFWVKDRKTLFNKVLSEPPGMMKIEGYSVREILDLVMYGSNEVHRESERNLEQPFKDAVTKYGEHHVYMSFAGAGRDLLGLAIQCYHVIKQDFDHWLTLEGVAGPDRLGLDDLHT
jgi:hypothetical protein